MPKLLSIIRVAADWRFGTNEGVYVDVVVDGSQVGTENFPPGVTASEILAAHPDTTQVASRAILYENWVPADDLAREIAVQLNLASEPPGPNMQTQFGPPSFVEPPPLVPPEPIQIGPEPGPPIIPEPILIIPEPGPPMVPFELPVIPVRANPADIAVSRARAFTGVPYGQTVKAEFTPSEATEVGVWSVSAKGVGADMRIEANRLTSWPSSPYSPRGRHELIVEVYVEGGTTESIVFVAPAQPAERALALQKFDPWTGQWVDIPASQTPVGDQVVLEAPVPGSSVYVVISVEVSPPGHIYVQDDVAKPREEGDTALPGEATSVDATPGSVVEEHEPIVEETQLAATAQIIGDDQAVPQQPPNWVLPAVAIGAVAVIGWAVLRRPRKV